MPTKVGQQRKRFKAAPAGESAGRSSNQRTKTKKRVGSFFNGVVSLTASEFVRAEECMTKPGEPTAAAHRGAEMVRKLYRNR